MKLAWLPIAAFLLGCSRKVTPPAREGADTSARTGVRQEPPAAPPAVPAATPEQIAHFDSLHAWGIGFGETRATLIHRLGRPSTHTVSPSGNPYADSSAHVVDSVHLLTFADLHFVVVWSGSSKTDLLSTVSVIGRARRLPGGITMNRTTAIALSAALGRPREVRQQADTSIQTYQLPTSESPETVEFYFQADTLRRVRWVVYLD